MTHSDGGSIRTHSNVYKDKSKPADIRSSNMNAAKALANVIRTSLGPKGMDKMIQKGNGEVTITNDGATILQQMNVQHPAAKLLVELSHAQDVEAGDGTTTVVILAGAILEAAEKLLNRGIHPTTISDAFRIAVEKAIPIIKGMSIPLQLSDTEQLIRSASTSLNSKVVSQHSSILAPLAVNAVMKIIDPKKDNNVDLKDIKIIKKLGGTVEDTELVDGLLLAQRLANINGPKKLEKVKIGLIQFCISPPKTDMDSNVVISDYAAMDRILKEERSYILNIAKQIKKAGCTMLLIQKSILRDALSDLAIHFFDKLKIMVVKDIEREDIEFLCKTLGCRPIASLDHFTSEALVGAELAEEVSLGTSRIVKVTGIHHHAKTVSILVRGSNNLVLEEAERSIHDALCVIRCLVKERALLPGGGAPEIELSIRLGQHAQTLSSVESYCLREYAKALEIIPYTLAENAGLNPVATVTELRNKHSDENEQVNAGINVRKEMILSGDQTIRQASYLRATLKVVSPEVVLVARIPLSVEVMPLSYVQGQVTDILEENVLQPMLVTTSAITLATETVRSILKIDDILNVQN